MISDVKPEFRYLFVCRGSFQSFRLRAGRNNACKRFSGLVPVFRLMHWHVGFL